VLRHKAPCLACDPTDAARARCDTCHPKPEAVLREQFARRPTWNQPHVTAASVRRPASCCNPLNQSMRVPACCDRPGLTIALLTLPIDREGEARFVAPIDVEIRVGHRHQSCCCVACQIEEADPP
jgi:hypothetical protein